MFRFGYKKKKDVSISILDFIYPVIFQVFEVEGSFWIRYHDSNGRRKETSLQNWLFNLSNRSGAIKCYGDIVVIDMGKHSYRLIPGGFYKILS